MLLQVVVSFGLGGLVVGSVFGCLARALHVSFGRVMDLLHDTCPLEDHINGFFFSFFFLPNMSKKFLAVK